MTTKSGAGYHLRRARSGRIRPTTILLDNDRLFLAKAAFERSRRGCDQLISTWAAVTGPTPGWASSTGAVALTSPRSSFSSAWVSV
jgi:hypothetical protein